MFANYNKYFFILFYCLFIEFFIFSSYSFALDLNQYVTEYDKIIEEKVKEILYNDYIPNKNENFMTYGDTKKHKNIIYCEPLPENALWWDKGFYEYEKDMKQVDSTRYSEKPDSYCAFRCINNFYWNNGKCKKIIFKWKQIDNQILCISDKNIVSDTFCNVIEKPKIKKTICKKDYNNYCKKIDGEYDWEYSFVYYWNNSIVCKNRNGGQCFYKNEAYYCENGIICTDPK